MDYLLTDNSWRNINPSGHLTNSLYQHKYTKQLCFFPPFDPRYLI